MCTWGYGLMVGCKMESHKQKKKNILVTGRVDVCELQPAFNVSIKGIEICIQLFDGPFYFSNAPKERYSSLPNGLLIDYQLRMKDKEKGYTYSVGWICA
jgi:hypothetical protein